ncbi:FecR family protein [Pedobacter antarcticus]|uniref:FecR family protein n=1 Tax=Pedobacter antarcticus TaxID=34086 RepID=UPI001C592459|nr:FecR domain-containing protein [Pedobacter antarcticus]
MDRSRIIELLARKMAGEANSSELEELASLISRYPDSVYYEELLGQLWQESPVENEHDTDDLYQKHLQKYAADFNPDLLLPEIYPDEEPSGKKSYKAFATIAICLVALSSLLYLTKSTAAKTDTQIVAGKGVRKNVRLPDGTMVWLNSDSKLSYSRQIARQKKRIVHLQGEAFFDVAHRDHQPFIVKTDRMSVKVLGTAFNVKDYAVENSSEATLLRGSIELSVNERAQQKILLNPSEKFALVDGQGKKGGNSPHSTDMTMTIAHVLPVTIGDEQYIEETSWKDNTLVFKNETLEELKPRLERWFNVKIHIESARAGSYRFTGAFKKEEIREAMTAMQLIKPFTFNLKEHDLIIY